MVRTEGVEDREIFNEVWARRRSRDSVSFVSGRDKFSRS